MSFSLTTEGFVSWEFAPDFDAGHRAALSTGKSLVYVSPPTWWAAVPLFQELEPVAGAGVHSVIVVPEALGVSEGSSILRSVQSLTPIHAVTGLARTGRRLDQKVVTTLVTTPSDLVELLSRSSLNLGSVQRIVIGWPELLLELGLGEELDTILAESRTSQRLIITADETRISDFAERHARRAPTVSAARIQEAASVSLRYSVTDANSTSEAVRSVLDIINPGSTLIWDPNPTASGRRSEYADDPTVHLYPEADTGPVDLALATDLPTAPALAMLAAAGNEVVVLLRGFQVPYLKASARRARSLRLPSAVDRARDRTSQLRDDIRQLIDQGRGRIEMLLLEPLFDEYDPATIAAALAAHSWAPEQPAVDSELQSWVRIRVNAGQRDRIRTADLVGALLNRVGVAKSQVGKVEVRDGHSVIEVRAEVAEMVRRELEGVVLRGKKVAARFDRR
jgi:ATP-dependent RNA helicase DeaD